jgi:hypothetical protein
LTRGRARAAAAPDGGARPNFAGETRYRIPGLGFGLGFAQGIERAKEDPIRGSRRTTGGRRRRPAARGGANTTVRPCGRGETGEGKRSSGRRSSPPRGAPGGLARRRGAAKQRRGGGLRREAAKVAVGAGARVFEGKAAAAARGAGWGTGGA